MFEAYKVAVHVALKDEVSVGLLGMSSSFKLLSKHADDFQKKLETIKKLAMVGVGFAAAGWLGMGIMKSALKPAEEYAHQLNIMNIAGMKHQQIAEAVAKSWQIASKIPTSDVVSNLKTFMDLRNIFGHTGEAMQYMPELTMIKGLLKSSSESSVSQSSENLSYSLAKALDIRGAVNSPAQFNEQAEMMAKVITATQGRVLPQDYQMLFKYGRQGVPGLSNQFLYQELPTFMQQMKGSGGGGSSGGFGTSIAAFYRFFVQGVMTKAALQGMQQLGLISASAGLKTTTVGTQLMQHQHVKGVDLAQSDPFLWVQNILLPAIRGKYGDNLTNNQLSRAITDAMRGASTTGIFSVLQYALKAQQVYRDEGLIKKVKDPKEAYAASLSNDPTLAFSALGAQWTNLKIAFGMGVIPVILPMISKLATGFTDFAAILRKYPTLTKSLAVGFMGLSASLIFLGTTLLIGAGGKGISMAIKILGLTMSAFSLDAGTLAFKFGSLIRLTLLFSLRLTMVGAAIYAVYELIKGIPALIDMFKSKKSIIQQAREYYSDPKNQTHVPSFTKKKEENHIHVHTHLDGKQIAHVVTKHQANESSRQPAHGSSFNGSMFLQPNMLNLAG